MHVYGYKSIVLDIWTSASQRGSYITMTNKLSCSATLLDNNTFIMVNSTLINGTYWWLLYWLPQLYPYMFDMITTIFFAIELKLSPTLDNAINAYVLLTINSLLSFQIVASHPVQSVKLRPLEEGGPAVNVWLVMFWNQYSVHQCVLVCIVYYLT